MARRVAPALVVALALYARQAAGVQPLGEFVASSQQLSVDVLEAQANVSLQGAQHTLELGRVLPNLAVKGTYTRNQYDVTVDLGPPFGSVTVVPKYQWDGFATLSVPLFDLAGYERIASAKSLANSAERQLDYIRLFAQATVAQNYYQLVAYFALVDASKKALDVSKESLRIASTRNSAGVAPQLDVDRAQADVEQQTQAVANADLQVSLAAQDLFTSSGLRPDLNPNFKLNDDLHSEPSLESFEKTIENLPSVQAAVEATRAAEQASTAAKFVLVPTLGGSIGEHGTNAPGFTGYNWTWQAVIGLQWQIDLTTKANIDIEDAALQVTQAREERVRLQARDNIHRYWNTVSANIVRSQSARAGAQAAENASKQARDRYEAGTIAEVTRIQADAELVNARAQLRLASGTSLVQGTGNP
jgi:outer membrane protein TolC